MQYNGLVKLRLMYDELHMQHVYLTTQTAWVHWNSKSDGLVVKTINNDKPKNYKSAFCPIRGDIHVHFPHT